MSFVRPGAQLVRTLTFASLFLGFSAASVATSQTPSSSAPDHARIEEILSGLNRGHAIAQVAISPDGKRLAWTQGGREGGDIYLAPIDNLKSPQRVTAGAKAGQQCHEGPMTWEPDSKALAFFSDCAHPGAQGDLYLSHLDGAAVQRLTELKGYVGAPAFSPDGSKIGFLYVEGATRPAGALAAMKPPAGVIGEDGVEIQRVAYVTANTSAPAAPTFATPGNLHVY